MYKLCTRLLECRYGIQREFVIGIYSDGRAGHDHAADGFVGFDEVFSDGVGDGDEMCLKVLGVLDYKGGVDDGGEGFVGEVATSTEIRTLILIGGRMGQYTSAFFGGP